MHSSDLGRATPTGFESKIAFVTGAASGIGLSCARMLLERGAQVAAFDRNDPIDDRRDELSSTDGRLLFIRGDVGSARDVESAIANCVAHFGGLDVALNCAGITGLVAPLAEQADDSLDATYAVNMRGIFLAMKHEAAAMVERNGGAIVNIASIFGRRTMQTFGLYGATKFGVIGLTQAGAIEFADANIRVNAVAPGPIMTPFVGPMTDELEREHSRHIPQHRFGRPDEVAHAMLWLASAEASYVTGAVLAVDGGQAAQLA